MPRSLLLLCSFVQMLWICPLRSLILTRPVHWEQLCSELPHRESILIFLQPSGLWNPDAARSTRRSGIAMSVMLFTASTQRQLKISERYSSCKTGKSISIYKHQFIVVIIKSSISLFIQQIYVKMSQMGYWPCC